LKKGTLLPLLAAMILLILDSRCAARSARDALGLCMNTLIPALFPLFVLSAMLVPRLAQVRIPGLARLLGFPGGSEGIFLLGCTGGFPLGAACISQAVQSGALQKDDAERMLGPCSLCGPSFIFGVIAAVLSAKEAVLLFLIQLESVLLCASFRPPQARSEFRGASMAPVSVPDALRRATASMASVCGWVMIAGIAAGFLRRWLAPLLPGFSATVLTGLLELTNGVFSLAQLPHPAVRFVVCAGFICFGGVSVLLQIGGLAGAAGLSMSACVAQKVIHSIVGTLLAALTAALGPASLLVGLIPPAVKIAVEISGMMVYNGGRKEGI